MEEQQKDREQPTMPEVSQADLIEKLAVIGADGRNTANLCKSMLAAQSKQGRLLERLVTTNEARADAHEVEMKECQRRGALLHKIELEHVKLEDLPEEVEKLKNSNRTTRIITSTISGLSAAGFLIMKFFPTGSNPK